MKINSDVMKKSNKTILLMLIRKGDYSRAELAARSGLTRAAISLICEELIEEGIICESGKKSSEGGRPAVVLRLEPRYGYIGGIDITRTRWRAGICDFSGGLVIQNEGPVDVTDAKNTLGHIKKALADMAGDKKLLGIGITAPGPLDKVGLQLGDVSNFIGWKNVCFKEFSNYFDCSVVLDNVSNALARAEYLVNPDCEQEYLELVLDSGVGSALADVRSNVKITECELGHITVDMNGKKCDCGNIGCAELYVNNEKLHGNAQDKNDFYNALCSVIVGARKVFSVRQAVFSKDFEEDFSALLKELEKRLCSRGADDITLTASRLKHMEVFTACNLMAEKLLEI